MANKKKRTRTIATLQYSSMDVKREVLTTGLKEHSAAWMKAELLFNN